MSHSICEKVLLIPKHVFFTAQQRSLFLPCKIPNARSLPNARFFTIMKTQTDVVRIAFKLILKAKKLCISSSTTELASVRLFFFWGHLLRLLTASWRQSRSLWSKEVDGSVEKDLNINVTSNWESLLDSKTMCLGQRYNRALFSLQNNNTSCKNMNIHRNRRRKSLYSSFIKNFVICTAKPE